MRIVSPVYPLFPALATLAMLVFSPATPAQEPAQATAPAAVALPAREKFDLYLLIGQSNMAGRGVLADEPPISPERILKFTEARTWTPAVEPLHTDKPAIAGAGLGMSFARVLADAKPGVTIGLIPCAVGGTPLKRWQKGGDLYAQALERARVAMQSGTLRGILWHQGESDSGSEETAKTYGQRFTQMIADLRADLGAGEVPVVAGELGDFLEHQGKDGRPKYWPQINKQIAALPFTVPNLAVALSTLLKDKGDKVHFDTASLREFGRRYAEAILAVEKP